MLKMGRGVSTEEKNERVEQAMIDVSFFSHLKIKLVSFKFESYFKLNLKKCEDVMIGSLILNIKGISGGERRRLAFASEVYV